MSSAEDGRPSIDWDGAEVDDRTLRVSLGGDLPRGWAARFRAVAARLDTANRQRWGAVRLAKGEITVEAVQEGSESDLRLLLESAAGQANADLVDVSSATEPQTAEEARDERMTTVFREFS